VNGLDLFSGIGGMSIGLKEWVRPVAYCESDPYCQGVLLSRQSNGSIKVAPIWDDILTLDGKNVGCGIDIIYGGFPCQDISTLGNGEGLEGKRSRLFFEIVRLAKEIKPTFLFLENVSAITRRGGPAIAKIIAEMGYDCRWCVISAEGLMAPQKRERWFLLAHSNGKSSGETDKNTESQQIKEKTWLRSSRTNWRDGFGKYWKENKRPSFGMDDGLPFELDRARALGNSVCPQQAKEAFKVLMGHEFYQELCNRYTSELMEIV
jgi:DNA (cytosine-5)-methyltransferase 1